MGVSSNAAGMQPPEGPPVCTALNGRSVEHPAADVEDHLPQGDPQRHFHQPRTLHLAYQGKGLGPLALFGAVLGEPVGAVVQDRGPRRPGFPRY